MIAAAECNDIAAVHACLQQRGTDVNCVDRKVLAIYRKQLVQLLISSNTVRFTIQTSKTALMTAAAKGFINIVTFLVQCPQVNVNMVDKVKTFECQTNNFYGSSATSRISR